MNACEVVVSSDTHSNLHCHHSVQRAPSLSKNDMWKVPDCRLRACVFVCFSLDGSFDSSSSQYLNGVAHT